MVNCNIVFATDKHYVQHLCVALVSLLKNNKEQFFKIYIINGGIPGQTYKKIEAVAEGYQCELVNITVDDDIFENLIINHHFTKAMYYRLLIPEFIQEEKLLYLDADIVVNGSIENLYKEDINGCFIGAVEDPGFNRHKELKMNSNSRYFNSGVMLINLKKWTEENLANKVIDFVENNPTLVTFPDQCGLNAVIDGNWKKLPLKYNQQALIFEKNFDDNYNCFTYEELSEAKQSPVIVHYSGSPKPWHFISKHPSKYLYWKYLRMTPYKYSLPTDLTPLNVLKWMVPEFIKRKLKQTFVGKLMKPILRK
ncbi:MAG: glycosyltransferase family 8 protein [Methylococcales bacterium]|nr:glycosyltransferase family 8 protein [Methylococcales bacterium]